MKSNKSKQTLFNQAAIRRNSSGKMDGNCSALLWISYFIAAVLVIHNHFDLIEFLFQVKLTFLPPSDVTEWKFPYNTDMDKITNPTQRYR